MGGESAQRGFLLQLLAGLLGSLKEDDWTHVEAEPFPKRQAADLAWFAASDLLRVMQVKSTISTFRKKAVNAVIDYLMEQFPTGTERYAVFVGQFPNGWSPQPPAPVHVQRCDLDLDKIEDECIAYFEHARTGRPPWPPKMYRIAIDAALGRLSKSGSGLLAERVARADVLDRLDDALSDALQMNRPPETPIPSIPQIRITDAYVSPKIGLVNLHEYPNPIVLDLSVWYAQGRPMVLDGGWLVLSCGEQKLVLTPGYRLDGEKRRLDWQDPIFNPQSVVPMTEEQVFRVAFFFLDNDAVSKLRFDAPAELQFWPDWRGVDPVTTEPWVADALPQVGWSPENTRTVPIPHSRASAITKFGGVIFDRGPDGDTE